jgi:replication factor A1
MSENTDYFTTKATIIYVKQDNISYPACLSEGCNKKVVEVDPGQWRCERCDKTHPKPEYRYIMSLNVSDHTGQIWLSCFDDVGRLIMGMTADQLTELKDNDEKAAGEVFQEANCKSWSSNAEQRLTISKINRGTCSQHPICHPYTDTSDRVRYQVSSASAIHFPPSLPLADLLKVYNLE